MKTRPRSSSSIPLLPFVAIARQPSNSTKTSSFSPASRTVARVPINYHKTSVVRLLQASFHDPRGSSIGRSIKRWRWIAGIVNHVPEEKGRPRRSGEAAKKAESRGGQRGRGWPENRDGGPRRKILAINYCATSRRSKLLLVLHRQ